MADSVRLWNWFMNRFDEDGGNIALHLVIDVLILATWIYDVILLSLAFYDDAVSTAELSKLLFVDIPGSLGGSYSAFSKIWAA